MAKIDTTRIEGFENMSAEEKLQALLGLDIEDHSAELEKAKAQLSRANSEAADWKKKHNALLTEDERKAAENQELLESLQSEVNSLRMEKTVSAYTAAALAAGFGEDSAKLAEALAPLPNEQASAVFGLLKANRTALEKSIKADLMRSNEKPGSVGGKETVTTKDQLMKMSFSERMKFANEHPDEYKAAYETE